MKNSVFLQFFLFLALSININSQWQADVRLTNDPAQSYTSYNSWSIASSGNIAHVVWLDFRDGNREIYTKRSTDGGVSWGADTRLTDNSAISDLPSVSVFGSAVHIVWMDNRDGNFEIYYKRSIDAGVIWGADTRLTNNSADSFYPSISVSGQVVHVVWKDHRDGNDEIYYKRSTDGGVSWGADTRLTNNSATSALASIAVSLQVVHVVWRDNRDGNGEIYYKRSTDGGVSWGADTRLTNNSATSALSSIAVSGQVVHVVWQDQRDGNDEIYYKRSIDGGVSWEADTRLTNNSAVSQLPSVSVSGQVVHVVWNDHRDVNYEIYYKRDPTGNPPISIININSEIPKEFSLSQNYPNPFNPVTNIKFAIAVGDAYMRPVQIKIYDALGREVTTLVNEELSPGTYEVEWDATNYLSGIYLYKLITDIYTETRKMILIK